MDCPSDLKYTKDHEWVKIDGNIATVGITDYAQDALGDVVFVELPEEGSEVAPGETFGVVESVKAVSDLYSPVHGRVIEINDAIMDSPEVVNEDAYGDAWMIKVELEGEDGLSELMDADQYSEYLAEVE